MATVAPYSTDQTHRAFNPGKRYDAIDWTKWDEVVNEFSDRIYGWYIRPAEHLQENFDHIGFSVLALCCMLIDTVSQWRNGALEGTNTLFKEFIREKITRGDHPLPTPITHYRSDTKKDLLKDCADVLYHGFRCGVLHEAHAKLYCMIEAKGQKEVFYIQETGLTYYDDRSDCVSVIIDPFELLAEVRQAFKDYIRELLDTTSTDHPKLRAHFQKKFLWEFGIKVA